MKHLKLELRHWTQADAMELTSLCNAVDRRFLSDRLPYPYTEEDAKAWLNMVAQNDSVTGIYRAIVMDGQPIGSISVEQKEDVYRIDGEIGFMLHGDYCNKGIMTEAIRQMCTIAFRDLPIERITANIFLPNTASMQVLRKNGFVHEGTMKRAIIKNDLIYDLCIFGLTKNNNSILK
ncbi:MAG: GNAT family N-acetyltransferase [Prevotella sp.]|nr:GNAT family N-acetyltransferase [Prevotella sp.]